MTENFVIDLVRRHLQKYGSVRADWRSRRRLASDLGLDDVVDDVARLTVRVATT
jgi:hypothetical protein